MLRNRAKETADHFLGQQPGREAGERDSNETAAMSTIASRRESQDKKTATLSYFLDGRQAVVVEEDTHLVDGIGGIAWEGALVLLQYLESLGIHKLARAAEAPLHIAELGGGCGILGIACAEMGFKVTITDRNSDLAQLNVSKSGLEGKADIHAQDLEWSDCTHGPLQSLISTRGAPDILCGAEITCLRKQQVHLVETLRALAENNPSAIALLTFDGLPVGSQPASAYEQEFIDRMTSAGFQHTLVFAGSVEWEKKDKNEVTGLFRDQSAQCSAPGARMTFPSHPNRISPSSLPPPPPPRGSQPDASAANVSHHVIAFYRPSSLLTCRHCHNRFPRLCALARLPTCRQHPGMYVCRYHPAELRCSISGLGDQLGYYSTGQEGWPATFWECCGSEDAKADGCKYGVHEAY